jgi:pyruvate/2-oxoglutarate dehydrogenase complex dihydrolipoamide acyltransferase (E2) component
VDRRGRAGSRMTAAPTAEAPADVAEDMSILEAIRAPGQSAIVTMGAVVERPVAVDGQLAVRPMMYLRLSLDHRVMDELEASRFLGRCRQWLEALAAGQALS